MPYSDLPEPKFRVGQTVWYADIKQVQRTLPCPDCLGAQTWRVATPAGGDYEVPCQRCCSGYTYTHHAEIAPLKYTEAEAAPRSFTVTKVGIDNWGDGPRVIYDGRDEGSLFATEEEARAASELRAAEHNAKITNSPERLAAKNTGKLRIGGAYYDQFANGLWNAWYAYRSVIDRLSEWIGEEAADDEKEYVAALRDSLAWEVEYREKQDRPLDAMVDAVAEALAGDASKLRAAYDALPETLRRRRAPAAQPEFV
jgi:hypothetical protein